MPGKRPAPLSDDVFAGGQPKVVGGALVGGAQMKVKNTFIDMPSGLTPSHMTNMTTAKPLQTAPADINQASGFVQRAIASNAVAATPADRSALQTPSSASYDAFRRANIIQSTPMATPSPTMHSRMFPAGGFISSFGNAAFTGVAPAASASAGPTSSAARIPAPPAWNPTVSTYIAGAPLGMTPETGIPAPPAYQPNVATPSSSSLFTAPAGGPASPLFAAAAARTFHPGPQPGDFVEEDDEDDDSGDELPMHLRNMKDAPQPPEGALHPSLGSAAHELGTCKRCCFFPRGRCTNGYNCEFCHYEHEKRKRKNKKKKKKSSMGASTVRATILGGGIPGIEAEAAAAAAAFPSGVGDHMLQRAPLSTAAPAALPTNYPQQFFSTTAAAPTFYQSAPRAPAPWNGVGYPPMQPPQFAAPPAQVMAPPPAAVAAPPGFVAYTASDGRQVFVQENAPAAAAPLATQPMGTLLGAPRASPPSIMAPDFPMPPPMNSPKLSSVLTGPSVPPPMASPKIMRGNLLGSVQQAAAAPGAYLVDAQSNSRVWMDSSTGPTPAQ